MKDILAKLIALKNVIAKLPVVKLVTFFFLLNGIIRGDDLRTKEEEDDDDDEYYEYSEEYDMEEEKT